MTSQTTDTTLATITSKDGTALAVDATGARPPVILIGGAFNDRSTVAAYGDQIWPWLATATKAVAAATPGARLVEVPGEDHGVLAHPAALELTLVEFFA